MSKDSARERAGAILLRRNDGVLHHWTQESFHALKHAFADEFETIRSETIKECAAACLVQIKRDSGYHGQWEGYGPWMGDMTGTECSAVILALDKR